MEIQADMTQFLEKVLINVVYLILFSHTITSRGARLDAPLA